MKDEKIVIDREVWEYFRSYRKAPFKKKYLEFTKIEQINPDNQKFLQVSSY
ncbi:MAG: hypothetical protein ACFE9I_06890 [Candidatus Hermodarchaeota archaeon]